MLGLVEMSNPIAISVMRDGDTLCTSIYSRAPEGKAGDEVYYEMIAAYMQLALSLDVSFIVEDMTNG